VGGWSGGGAHARRLRRQPFPHVRSCTHSKVHLVSDAVVLDMAASWPCCSAPMRWAVPWLPHWPPPASPLSMSASPPFADAWCSPAVGLQAGGAADETTAGLHALGGWLRFLCAPAADAFISLVPMLHSAHRCVRF
jgi:hypothetical protein